MTTRERVWHRLSPRMLLVHPVHEVLRQIPLLIGSVVRRFGDGQPVVVGRRCRADDRLRRARWFTTTYRIDAEEVQLRTGVLQRKVLSLPRNRIRSVQTDARLLHRLLGLTVLRVEHRPGGQGGHGVRARRGARRGGAAAALDPARRLAGRRRRRPKRRHRVGMLARWQPSWLRYSPLSFTGLAMILAAVGVTYQAGLGAALEHSRLAEPGATPRSGSASSPVSPSSAWSSCSRRWCLSVLRSLVTFGNLVLRRDADGVASAARSAARARAHLRHAQAARRHAAPAAAGAAARRRSAGCGDDGRRGCGGGVAAAAAVPRAHGRVGADRADRRRRRGVRSGARARTRRDAQALDAGAGVPGRRRGRPGASPRRSWRFRRGRGSPLPRWR